MAYTIKPGDTLSEIAAANNTTVKAIQDANSIPDANVIQAGATLNIPGSSSSGNNNGIIGDIKAVGNSIKNAALDFAGSTGLKPATYSVGADGKGISKGGLNDATIMDFPALLLNSIINAEEAAKLNPYWNDATKTYDKFRRNGI